MVTAAGQLNKVNGDIFYAEDVTAITNLQKLAYSNIAQNLYNAKYIGFNSSLNGSGSPNLYNIVYGIRGTMNIATTVGTTTTCINNSGLFQQNNIYMIGKVYDYMEGTSVNTSNWEQISGPAATLTQVDNSYVQLSYSSSSNVGDIVLSAKALDLKGSGTNGECIVKVLISGSTSDNHSSSAMLYLRDESGNQITLLDTGYIFNGASIDKVLRLIFTSNNVKVCDISSNWTSSGSDISTSTLSGSIWHLRGEAVGGGGSGIGGSSQVRFYPIFYVDGSSITTEDIITTAVTTNSNVSTSYLNYNGTSTGIAPYFSGNGGTNYTAISNNSYASIGTNGTSCKLKFTLGGSVTELPKLYEYALFYGVW